MRRERAPLARGSRCCRSLARRTRNERERFVGIAPGSYRLLAWKLGVADGNTVLYDPDFLKPYEARARIVQVAPSSRETVQLQAIP